MTKVKKNPNYIKELANKKYERDKNRQTVAKEVEEMLDQDLHISSLSMIKNHLKESKDIDVKDWLLKDIMREELDLRYKRIKEVSWQGNSDKNKILR